MGDNQLDPRVEAACIAYVEYGKSFNDQIGVWPDDFAPVQQERARERMRQALAAADAARPLPLAYEQGLIDGRAESRGRISELTHLCTILDARLAATPSRWRPIEEAPKDGTPCVLLTADGSVVKAAWEDNRVLDDDYKPCGAWVASNDDEFPPSWSSGICWSSNADDEMSDRPVMFVPLPHKEGE